MVVTDKNCCACRLGGLREGRCVYNGSPPGTNSPQAGRIPLTFVEQLYKMCVFVAWRRPDRCGSTYMRPYRPREKEIRQEQTIQHQKTAVRPTSTRCFRGKGARHNTARRQDKIRCPTPTKRKKSANCRLHKCHNRPFQRRRQKLTLYVLYRQKDSHKQPCI